MDLIRTILTKRCVTFTVQPTRIEGNDGKFYLFSNGVLTLPDGRRLRNLTFEPPVDSFRGVRGYERQGEYQYGCSQAHRP